MTASACVAELKRRKLPTQPARGKTPGLVAPLRLAGPLNEVTFELPKTVYGLMDCRLVLMLAELSGELRERGVVRVVVNNTYRPRSLLSAKRSAQRAARPSQHALGLAIDIMAFQVADGRVLNVQQDWHGALGEEPCGPNSRIHDETPEAVELRNLTCAIAAQGYCNHLITPNRDKEHFNHLHCDIEAGAREVTIE